MKKLTRKLFISILSMAFAVIAIGTTTFAWITVSNTATVNQFGANVEVGAGGIELSLNYKDSEGVVNDDATWTNSLNITSEDFIDFKGSLSDVALTDNDGTFKELQVNGNVASYAEISTEADMLPYIKIEFWVRNTNPAAGNLTVSLEDIEFGGTESSSYAPDIDVPGYLNPDNSRKTITNLLASNAARMRVVAEGADNKTVMYQQTEGVGGNTTGSSLDGFSHKYFTAKGIKFGTESNPLTAPTDLNYIQANVSNQTLITTLATTPVKVTLYVWIEGWDNECHAKILTHNLTVSLGLTSAPVQADPAPQE